MYCAGTRPGPHLLPWRRSARESLAVDAANVLGADRLRHGQHAPPHGAARHLRGVLAAPGPRPGTATGTALWNSLQWTFLLDRFRTWSRLRSRHFCKARRTRWRAWGWRGRGWAPQCPSLAAPPGRAAASQHTNSGWLSSPPTWNCKGSPTPTTNIYLSTSGARLHFLTQC